MEWKKHGERDVYSVRVCGGLLLMAVFRGKGEDEEFYFYEIDGSMKSASVKNKWVRKESAMKACEREAARLLREALAELEQ